MPTWDPTAYATFAAERGRPFADLVARVRPATEPRQVVDVGCGPGDLTASLARRWPAAQVLGLDSSPAMLERAAAHAGDRVRFAAADAASWLPPPGTDVVVANALLQWVPDHLAVLARWVDALAAGSRLAVQVPGNLASPSHVAIREVADRPRYREHLAGRLRDRLAVAEPAQYAAVLAGAGCEVDVWETTYLHVLDPAGELGDDAVLAWVSGTGLRPVTDALADVPDVRDAYLADLAAELRTAYPRRPWGTLLPFRRIFAVARVR